MTKRGVLFCFFISILSTSLLAQQELTLNFMPKLMQSQNTNASYLVEDRLLIGLPSFSFNLGNSGFSYRDLIQAQDNGGSILAIEEVIDDLDNRNIMQMQLNIDLLRTSFHIKQHYFSFIVTESIYAHLNYSRNLPQLAWYGNAPLVGKDLDLAPRLNAGYYREMVMGYGRKIGNWNFGARLRYYNGIVDVHSRNTQINLRTDAETFGLNLDAMYRIETSGLERFADEPFSFTLRPENNGAGIDLGATYKLDQNWTFSAALHDLGFIRWQFQNRNFSNESSLDFDGIDLRQFRREGGFDAAAFADSLSAQFSPEESNEAYTHWMNARLNLTAFYRVNRLYRLGSMLSFDRFGRLLPGVSVFGAKQLTRKTEFGISYSYRNKSFTNLGFVVHYRGKRIESFFVTDHIGGLIAPLRTRNINFRWGVNIPILGPPKPKEARG